jgi:hypothetical protein
MSQGRLDPLARRFQGINGSELLMSPIFILIPYSRASSSLFTISIASPVSSIATQIQQPFTRGPPPELSV